ncbi:hypothetical protein NKJ50_29595 [Mesorhizobium sp. M0115]|uniref:hypothetical protein n=1 Tax=unclassified Mesorhizobium TaxID=325217 RepID=UPI00333D7B9F
MFRIGLEGEGQFVSAPNDIAYAAVPDHPRVRASRPDFVHQQRRDFLQPAQCFRAREVDSLGLGAAIFLEPVNG